MHDSPSAPADRFAIYGPIERSDLPGLCRRVCSLLERSRARVMLCDVTGVAAGAVCVDALARLALAGQRRGCLIRLHGVSPELAALVALMGLEEVLLEESPRGVRLTPAIGTDLSRRDARAARTAGTGWPCPKRK